MIYTRPSTDDDLQPLADTMRKMDAHEVMCSSGVSPFLALKGSKRMSPECNTIVEVGTERPVAMYGVAVDSMHPKSGVPWMLVSDYLFTSKEHNNQFIKGAKKWVAQKQREFTVLVNYVHCDNKLAIRWLKKLGFVFTRKVEDFGLGDEPFYEFVMIQPD